MFKELRRRIKRRKKYSRFKELFILRTHDDKQVLQSEDV